MIVLQCIGAVVFPFLLILTIIFACGAETRAMEARTPDEAEIHWNNHRTIMGYALAFALLSVACILFVMQN